MPKIHLTIPSLYEHFRRSAEALDRLARRSVDRIGRLRVYPIPRGGVSALGYVLDSQRSSGSAYDIVVVDAAEEADVFFDDLVDSGRTRERYSVAFPEIPFITLVAKSGPGATFSADDWLVFPWERSEKEEDTSVTDNVVRILEYIGEDPQREGLIDTPKRVVKAWEEWTSGYKVDIAAVLKTFEDGASDYNEMILERHIPFHSHCEHHMAPFFGTVHFAYIPGADCPRIVGLSKMNRLVEAFARRLQVQERMTTQIVDTFNSIVQPAGVGIIVRGVHTCVCSRGVRHTGCDTITSAYRGVMFQPTARQEFLSLCSLP